MKDDFGGSWGAWLTARDQLAKDHGTELPGLLETAILYVLGSSPALDRRIRVGYESGPDRVLVEVRAD